MIETVNGDILVECEDYHLLDIQTFCLIKDDKHVITTIVDYVKNQKHYRKVFENILEGDNNNEK